MKYGQLDATDLTVSQLALGTGPLGELFGPVEESTAFAVVQEALDLVGDLARSNKRGGATRTLDGVLAGKPGQPPPAFHQSEIRNALRPSP